MPTNQEIGAARLRGVTARNEAEQLLLDPEQQAQLPPNAAAHPHANLPRPNTTAMARLFNDAFGDDVQPPEAVPATTINSRTGHSVSINDPPQQHFTTDSHARVQQDRRRSRSGSRRNTRRGAAAAPLPQDIPPDVPQDVLDEMERERIEAQGGVLMDDDAIQADINHVINSRIAKKTRKNYDDYIVRFVMFLFDHREKFPALIPPPLLTKLEAAAVSDLHNVTRRGVPKKQRKFIRKAIAASFLTINPADQSTHPIVLEQLEFQTIAHYLSTFSKKATRTSVNGRETLVPYKSGDDDSLTVHLRLGESSYDSVTSSLANLFKECKVARDVNEQVKEMWSLIGIYKKGAARDGAQQRRNYGLRQSEGKDPLPFQGYELLCSILHRSKDPKHIAAHLFLTLDWNMLSRVDYIVNSNIEFVGMSSDALRFDVGLTKTDQEGKNNIDHPFHVYSCPENPVICPVLAMAKHLCKSNSILGGNSKLFEGSNQYEHYFAIFRSIVNSDEHRQSFIDRGMNPKYFGTHSMRKGAVTHIASGVTSSPPIASICIRANWKMPGVMNRYIKWESAGDQYVGR